MYGSFWTESLWSETQTTTSLLAIQLEPSGSEQVDGRLVRIDVGIGAAGAGVERVVDAVTVMPAGHQHLVDRDRRIMVDRDVEFLDDVTVDERRQVDVAVRID